MDDLVFLFDVDNTLLDNDARPGRSALASRLKPSARRRSGATGTIFEELRSELGYADYLGALERYRAEDLHDPRLLRMSSWLVDYPFADRLYPGALEVVRHVRQWGRPVVLSDGDAVFQPRKVERSGIWKAFDGDILIYIHKEEELDDVERIYPAKRYVLIDDKLRILAAVKSDLGRSRDHGVSPAGALRERSEGARRLSRGRRRGGAYRGPHRARPRRVRAELIAARLLSAGKIGIMISAPARRRARVDQSSGRDDWRTMR